ncbi:hypothetical protein ACQ859_30035 [Roseateles chitinivorans]|uniref:hypothetical protein n=1 Tax=Roseateles chitinivorans TaxID=2917965 RepID=UPI003D66DE08
MIGKLRGPMKAMPGRSLWPLLVMALAVAFVVARGASAEERLVPEKWKLDYRQKSIGAIVDELGAPQDVATAKQFLNWVEPTPTGVRLLKVLCPEKCEADEKPSSVLFIVLRGEEKKQVHTKVLFDARHGASPRRTP